MNTAHRLRITLGCLAAAFTASCTTTERSVGPSPGDEWPESPLATRAAPSGSGDTEYLRSSTFFPTGLKEGSALEVTKVVPKESIVGQTLTYQMLVKNISAAALKDVALEDTLSGDFEITAINPEPESAEGNRLAWMFASIDPGQTIAVNVSGTSGQEGMIEHCATVSYNAVVCAETQVVSAAIGVVQTLPATALLCDPIPMRMVVSNTGSSRLTNVHLRNNLPAGLATADGETSYWQEIGTLEAGQTREYSVNLKAARVGAYDSIASVDTAEDVNAMDEASITVVQPTLAVSCDSPADRFAGRPVPVTLSVLNTGEVSAADAQVVLNLPSGARLISASDGGVQQGNTVVWNLGSLAAEMSRELRADIASDSQGMMSFTALARGDCADEVRDSSATQISGIAALLLEVVDLADPIEVGSTETYEITVTNQGTAPATDVQIVCMLEDAQAFVSGTGTSAVSARGQTITMAPVSSIPAKGSASWRVVVRAQAAGDVRFHVTMTSGELERPVEETESTKLY